MPELNFEDITNDFKLTLSDGFSSFMKEACIVALNSQNHQTDTELIPYQHQKSIYTDSFKLIWQEKISNKLLNTHNDENRTTDYGAMFLSLALTLKLTNYDEFEVSYIGSGVDFWLTSDSENFLSARLEVSGIRKGKGTNTIENRLKTKKQQVKQTDNSNLPAYISIIEFHEPQALYVKK